MNKYRSLYRISSSRLPDWDYSSEAYYFVTICTKDKVEFFGKVINGSVQLSEIGEIAKACWKNIPNHFSTVALDAFIIMPNHIHGILQINHNTIVETQYIASLQEKENNKHRKNKFAPQSNNLASIIRGYKIGVKVQTIKQELQFFWQPGYYDHVIRNDKSLYAIQEYIINNPTKWEIDEYNSCRDTTYCVST